MIMLQVCVLLMQPCYSTIFSCRPLKILEVAPWYCSRQVICTNINHCTTAVFCMFTAVPQALDIEIATALKARIIEMQNWTEGFIEGTPLARNSLNRHQGCRDTEHRKDYSRYGTRPARKRT